MEFPGKNGLNSQTNILYISKEKGLCFMLSSKLCPLHHVCCISKRDLYHIKDQYGLRLVDHFAQCTVCINCLLNTQKTALCLGVCIHLHDLSCICCNIHLVTGI